MWAIGTELDKTVKSIEQKRFRNTDRGGTGLDHYDDNSKVMIVEIQWVEREVFYLIADEATSQKLQINEAQYQHMAANAKKIEERLGGRIQVMPTAARMTRKIYKRAFLGNELLQSGDAPIKGRYWWSCITGELDRNKGHWFGLIKTMTFCATDSMNQDSNNETRAETHRGDGTNPPRETRQQTRQRVASEAFAEDQTNTEAKATAARTLADTSARAETGTAVAGEASVEGRRVRTNKIPARKIDNAMLRAALEESYLAANP